MRKTYCLSLFVVAWFVCSPVLGQTPTGDTQRFTPFRGTSYGMFGQERYGEVESPLAPTSSFTKAFRFSRDGFFRGYDIESDESAIFRDVPPPEPVEALTREDVRVKRVPEPSVNRPLNAPSGGSQQRTVSRPPSLLEQEYRRLRAEQSRFREGLPAEIPSLGQGENAAAPQQRWMRDLGGQSRTPATPNAPSSVASPSAGITAGAASPFVGNAQVVGGTNSPPQTTPVTDTPAPQRTTGNPQTGRALERTLETMLITSPDLSLLSPVQIRIAGSTATLRGVVATDEQRAAASRVILAHPSVQTVNNLMTVVPLDTSQLPPPIEPQ